jgi:hypothetical protein
MRSPLEFSPSDMHRQGGIILSQNRQRAAVVGVCLSTPKARVSDDLQSSYSR